MPVLKSRFSRNGRPKGQCLFSFRSETKTIYTDGGKLYYFHMRLILGRRYAPGVVKLLRPSWLKFAAFPLS